MPASQALQRAIEAGELLLHCPPKVARSDGAVVGVGVTESQLAGDRRTAMGVLTRLRLRSVGLSIDDFDTGLSSLAQFREMPVGELKIDRGFVHCSGEPATLRATFTASLVLSHRLGMTAVSQGVEDRADRDVVQAAGCELAQGCFVVRPMPAEQLHGWAAAWRARFEAW